MSELIQIVEARTLGFSPDERSLGAFQSNAPFHCRLCRKHYPLSDRSSDRFLFELQGILFEPQDIARKALDRRHSSVEIERPLILF